MNEFGADIVIEGEMAKAFLQDMINPSREEALQRKTLLDEWSQRCRMIESTAGRTVFEIDDDLFDVASIFGDDNDTTEEVFCGQIKMPGYSEFNEKYGEINNVEFTLFYNGPTSYETPQIPHKKASDYLIGQAKLECA